MQRFDGFKFNLLPKPSKKEVAIIKQRDNSLFYATTIVTFSSVAWLLTSLLLNQVVNPALANKKADIARIDQQIAAYDYAKAAHGELVIKSNALKPLLEKRLNTDIIFTVANALVANVPGTGIFNYGREADGKLVFEVMTADYPSVSKVMQNARAIDNVSEVELRTSAYNSTTNVVFNNIALRVNDTSK